MNVLHFPRAAHSRPRPGWTDRPQRHRITRHGNILPMADDAALAALENATRALRRGISVLLTAALFAILAAGTAALAVGLGDTLAKAAL